MTLDSEEIRIGEEKERDRGVELRESDRNVDILIDARLKRDTREEELERNQSHDVVTHRIECV